MRKSLREVAKGALTDKRLILRPQTTDEIREHIGSPSRMAKTPHEELRDAVHMNTVATLMLIDKLERM